MFDFKHYIPVLRWKAAEKDALKNLSEKSRERVTPLLEIIMPSPKNFRDENNNFKPTEVLLKESISKLKSNLLKTSEEILRCWGKLPVFIDFNLIAGDNLKVESLNNIIKDAAASGIKLVPITNLNSNMIVQKNTVEASLVAGYGLGFRLFRSNFDDPQLLGRINTFLTINNLSKSNIDLFIDLQITDNECLKLSNLMGEIPNILEWRTFTVISGAFPKDLSGLAQHNRHLIDRTDWNCWLKQINSEGLERKPSFGDYSIQHPIYKEPQPGSNPSASIRYTLKDKWLIMRGEGLRNEKGSGHQQYPAYAQLLSNDSEFFGKDFSFGDAYIAQKGENTQIKKTGTPRTWLTAGINHHITCTVSQISNLP